MCLIDVYKETTSMVISTELCVRGRFRVLVSRSVELMSVDGCLIIVGQWVKWIKRAK